MIEIQQIAAAIYMLAGIAALLGVALPAPRMSRASMWGLALGAVTQALSIATLHRLDPVPALTSLPVAVSLMVWTSIVFVLILMWRMRLDGLAAVIGPVAFAAVFLCSVHMTGEPPTEDKTGSMPHAHVLLSSAGLGLLGVAGLAGLFFLLEHRRIKSKKLLTRSATLPSLEALDRANVASLAIGFPLLTLGVVTGAAWVNQMHGQWLSGDVHETWTLVAWVIYAGLTAARFAGRQGARQAAASAVAGFAFLLFAVVGVGILT